MTLAKQNYMEQQLFQVAPLPLTEENFPYGFDIKICSTSMGSDRATNYLRITPEQMKKIENNPAMKRIIAAMQVLTLSCASVNPLC